VLARCSRRAPSAGKQTVVANAVEAVRQHVDEEAADECPDFNLLLALELTGASAPWRERVSVCHRPCGARHPAKEASS
jgi:hypothetical protein